MGHAKLLCGFHLRHVAEVTQLDQPAVPLLQLGQHLPQREQIGKLLLRRGDRQVQLGAVLLAGERNRRRSRAQRLHHCLLADLQRLRQLADRRFPAVLLGKLVALAGSLHRELLEAAADLDGAAVPKQPAHLAQNHRHRIGGKAHTPLAVKGVGGFDQPHAARLEQVVVLDTLALKAVGAGVHQPDVFLDHPAALFLLPGGHPLILRRGHRAHGFHLRGAFPWRSLWRESSFPA